MQELGGKHIRPALVDWSNTRFFVDVAYSFADAVSFFAVGGSGILEPWHSVQFCWEVIPTFSGAYHLRFLSRICG